MSAYWEPSVLDLEHLQQMSYSRSRIWALFLDSISVTKEKVVELKDVDEIFRHDAEDEAGLTSMEDNEGEALDSDVLRDVTNSIRVHSNSFRIMDPTIAPDNANEIVDLLNQTLPVINEHNRQLKESGLERILNTFDAKKIEEKVGGWLRRQNPLCAPYKLVLDYKHNQGDLDAIDVPKNKSGVKTHKNFSMDDTDSVDSFHSGETARYIRSSRAGATKNSSSPTMMIKTYRKVKSSRQALKAKYACAHDEDAELHLSNLRHRRRLANEVENRHTVEKYSSKPYNSKAISNTPSYASYVKKKSRVLRKRSVSHSCSAKDTSSDSDSSYYSRETAHKIHHRIHKYYKHHHKTTKKLYADKAPVFVGRSQRKQFAVSTAETSLEARLQFRHTKMDSCGRSKDYYFYEKNISESSSPLSSPASQLCRKKPLKWGDRCGCSDHRTLKYESKCLCLKKSRLRQKYRQLSNLSTDEWIVESGFTRRRMILPHPDQRQRTVEPPKTLSVTGITTSKNDSSTMSTSISCAKSTSATPPALAPENLKTINDRCENSNQCTEYSDDGSFDRELQLALIESKKLFDEEAKKVTPKPVPKNSNKKQMISSVKPLTGASSMKITPLGNALLKRQLDEDTCVANKKNQKKSDKLKDEELIFQSKPNSSGPLVYNKSETNKISEDSFFTASHRVCNSTALQNHKTACERQFVGVDGLTNHGLGTNISVNLKKVPEENEVEEKAVEKVVLIKPKESTSLECRTLSKTRAKQLPRTTFGNNISVDVKYLQNADTTRSKQNSSKLKKSTRIKDDFICEKSEEMRNKISIINTDEKLRTNAKMPSLVVENRCNSNDIVTQAVDIPINSVEEISSDLDSSETKPLPNNRNSEIKSKIKKQVSSKNKYNSNVSSTTFQTPENALYLTKTVKKTRKRRIMIASSTDDNENDCTVVSSTTTIEGHMGATAPEADRPSTSGESTTTLANNYNGDDKKNMSSAVHNHHHPTKGILIYGPHNASLSATVRRDGCFVHITKEHLSSVIGEKPAEKFLKYYIGRRRFNWNSTVYYKPPATQVLDTFATTSSDSDEDDLERMGKYGQLYESNGGDASGVADVMNE